MPTCVNDFSPIIVAIAGIIAIQVPLIITHALNNIQARQDADSIKAITNDNNKKLDNLETISKNGFYQQSINYSAPTPPPQSEVNPPIEDDKGLPFGF